MGKLDQRDLSVRETTSHIAVTERTTSAVFKNNLALTPSKLICRYCQLEEIRRNFWNKSGECYTCSSLNSGWAVAAVCNFCRFIGTWCGTGQRSRIISSRCAMEVLDRKAAVSPHEPLALTISNFATR